MGVERWTVKELMEMPELSKDAAEAQELRYRRGFTDGFNYGVDCIEMLYSKGFMRPTEIANIMRHYLLQSLYDWVRGSFSSRGKTALQRFGHPKLKHESWHDIKRRIRDRDKDACAYCGSKENPQVDHALPVKYGGKPTDNNLQVLCADCNRRKGGRI